MKNMSPYIYLNLLDKQFIKLIYFHFFNISSLLLKINAFPIRHEIQKERRMSLAKGGFELW